jgi:hypothetical protein
VLPPGLVLGVLLGLRIMSQLLAPDAELLLIAVGLWLMLPPIELPLMELPLIELPLALGLGFMLPPIELPPIELPLVPLIELPWLILPLIELPLLCIESQLPFMASPDILPED